jgi:hypothetical protein
MIEIMIELIIELMIELMIESIIELTIGSNLSPIFQTFDLFFSQRFEKFFFF